MRILILLIFVLAYSNIVNAQFKFERNGVTIQTFVQEVKNKSSNEYGYMYEIAQISNSSSEKKTVSFHVDMYYDGICSNCSNKEYLYTFNLAPGEVLKGNILDRTSSGLKYFKEDKNKRITSVLTDLQLTSFIVE